MCYVLIQCEPHIVAFFCVVLGFSMSTVWQVSEPLETEQTDTILYQNLARKTKRKHISSLSLPLTQHSPRCSYWSRDLRSGGDPGCPGQRLLLLPVPLLTAPPASARPLVLPANVSLPLLLLLQELCLHHGALLVWLLLWLLCTGIAHEEFGQKKKKKEH